MMTECGGPIGASAAGQLRSGSLPTRRYPSRVVIPRATRLGCGGACSGRRPTASAREALSGGVPDIPECHQLRRASVAATEVIPTDRLCAGLPRRADRAGDRTSVSATRHSLTALATEPSLGGHALGGRVSAGALPPARRAFRPRSCTGTLPANRHGGTVAQCMGATRSASWS